MLVCVGGIVSYIRLFLLLTSDLELPLLMCNACANLLSQISQEERRGVAREDMIVSVCGASLSCEWRK